MGSSLRRKGCKFKKDINLAIISIGPLKIDHRIFESIDRNCGERPLKRTLKINTKNKNKKIERQHKQENPFRSRDPDQGHRCISLSVILLTAAVEISCCAPIYWYHVLNRMCKSSRRYH